MFEHIDRHRDFVQVFVVVDAGLWFDPRPADGQAYDIPAHRSQQIGVRFGERVSRVEVGIVLPVLDVRIHFHAA